MTTIVTRHSNKSKTYIILWGITKCFVSEWPELLLNPLWWWINPSLCSEWQCKRRTRLRVKTLSKEQNIQIIFYLGSYLHSKSMQINVDFLPSKIFYINTARLRKQTRLHNQKTFYHHYGKNRNKGKWLIWSWSCKIEWKEWYDLIWSQSISDNRIKRYVWETFPRRERSKRQGRSRVEERDCDNCTPIIAFWFWANCIKQCWNDSSFNLDVFSFIWLTFYISKKAVL